MLGKSDHEALDTLKKALAAASTEENAKLRLVVARTMGINRKPNLSMGSFSSQMAALGEVSEEEVSIKWRWHKPLAVRGGGYVLKL